MARELLAHHGIKPQWWVIQQHDEFTVEQRAGMPERTAEGDERHYAFHGPYPSQQAADAKKASLYARTLKGQREKAGM